MYPYHLQIFKEPNLTGLWKIFLKETPSKIFLSLSEGSRFNSNSRPKNGFSTSLRSLTLVWSLISTFQMDSLANLPSGSPFPLGPNGGSVKNWQGLPLT